MYKSGNGTKVLIGQTERNTVLHLIKVPTEENFLIGLFSKKIRTRKKI